MADHAPGCRSGRAPLGECSDAFRWVTLVDPDAGRTRNIRSLLARSGLRERPVSQAEGAGPHAAECALALVAVRLVDGSPHDSSLKAIARLRGGGAIVIAYGDGVHSWPIGVRCRVLLAGAKRLFDAATQAFEDLLSASLAAEADTLRRKDTETRDLRALACRYGILGDSGAMIEVVRQLVRFSALSSLPVLITGESGTGKELVASAIGALDAKRRDHPFISVNCAAIAASLAESELFGNVKGAFTGAVAPRKGYFFAAHTGTLFLDEIGELDLDLQAKLLRVLEEKAIWQVGADRPTPVDVRIIAATNRDLAELIKARRFREDLFFRLNILTIRIPPLRERREDLRPLAEYFLANAALAEETAPPRLDDELIDALSLLPLHGNARELRNLVVLAAARRVGTGAIGLADLPPDLWRELSRAEPMGAEPEPNGETEAADFPLAMARRHGWKLEKCLADCEQQIVEAAMREARYNQSRAARLLGLTPRSIYNKLKKHRLPTSEAAIDA
jgi:transcriptional regulator with PAS, ATPase and Fis domain